MLTEQQLAQLDWDKTQGMMPVIVQHNVSGEVRMHGYMNQPALEKTLAEGNVLAADQAELRQRWQDWLQAKALDATVLEEQRA